MRAHRDVEWPLFVGFDRGSGRLRILTASHGRTLAFGEVRKGDRNEEIDWYNVRFRGIRGIVRLFGNHGRIVHDLSVVRTFGATGVEI